MKTVFYFLWNIRNPLYLSKPITTTFSFQDSKLIITAFVIYNNEFSLVITNVFLVIMTFEIRYNNYFVVITTFEFVIRINILLYSILTSIGFRIMDLSMSISKTACALIPLYT